MLVRFAAAGAACSLGHVARRAGLGLVVLMGVSGAVSAQNTSLLLDVEQSTYDGGTDGDRNRSSNCSTNDRVAHCADHVPEDERDLSPVLEQGGGFQGPEKTSKALR